MIPIEIEVLEDTRLGRPSASSMERYMACAGCRNLEREVDRQTVPLPDQNTAATESGVVLHKANETGDVSELEESEAETVQRIREIEHEITAQWISDNGFKYTSFTIQREVRLWIDTDLASASAQIDTLVTFGSHALILDTKTGRGDVTMPVRNWQLRTAAVAVYQHLIRDGYEPKDITIRVAIVQPFAKAQSACDYSAADLMRALNTLVLKIRYMENPDAPRTAGSHCQWCRAKHICPEARDSMSSIIATSALNWGMLAPDRKLRLWNAAKLAESVAAMIKDQVKADLTADPDCIPGLIKKPDQTPVSVSDVWGVISGINRDGYVFTVEEILAACKSSVSNMAALYASKTGVTQKKAEQWIKEKCATHLTTGHRSGEVKATGGKS